jgi:hypothetical protein
MFYRTVFQVEVLSRGQLPEGAGLTYIAYEIVEGDCSGNVEVLSEDAVDGPTMARLLREQGSEPMFLGLSDDGEDEE